MVKVSIIIPNYNGERLLKKNLPRVIANVRQLAEEIIIIDDASIDNSVVVVKEFMKKNKLLRLIKNKRNLGFASTVNKGVREAKGEIVVLLNTDVFPQKGFLLSVLPHFDNPQVFAVGLMDKSIEGKKTVLRGRGLARWSRGFYVHQRGEIDQTDTAWVTGGSGAFRRSVFQKLGGFAKVYNPFYWEDIDLSYRAVKAGYKILFESKAVVVHEHEKGSIKQKFSGKQMELISYRNQFLFVWRNANFCQWLNHLFWLPYHLIFTTIKSRGFFLLGFLLALVKLPELLTKPKLSCL